MSDKSCKQPLDAQHIASELNNGHGDCANKMMLELVSQRVLADPEGRKSVEDRNHAPALSEKWLDAAERGAAIQTKVGSELTQEIKKAQEATAGPQLCKLEITDNGTFTPKSKTCQVTELTFNEKGELVIKK